MVARGKDKERNSGRTRSLSTIERFAACRKANVRDCTVRYQTVRRDQQRSAISREERLGEIACESGGMETKREKAISFWTDVVKESHNK